MLSRLLYLPDAFHLLLMLSFLTVNISSSLFIFPNIRLFHPHSKPFVQRELIRAVGVKYNHEHVGVIHKDPKLYPKGYSVLNKTVYLGNGEDLFHRCSDIVLSFKMINYLNWAKVCTLAPIPLNVGSPIATLVQCYKLIWSLNPCRIVSLEKNLKTVDGGRVSQVAFCTLHGHLVAGEEMFQVSMDSKGNVTYKMCSFTRGAGVIGTAVMPFIRPIQRAFFVDQSKFLVQVDPYF